MADDRMESVGDSNRGWVRHPYGCAITGSYSDYRSQLVEVLVASKMEDASRGFKDSIDMSDEKAFESNEKEAEAIRKVIDEIKTKKDEGSNNIETHLVDLPSVSDSSIFGNDAINPYAGFCRDDDIVHSAYTSDIGDHVFKMGRVYREIYDSKQQVVYMQFGIPKYRNLFHYIMNATSSEMSDANDVGDTSIISKIANFFIDGTKLAVNIVTWPIEFCHRIFNGLDSVKLTEYFYFREQMFMYWNHVNMILVHLASGIGLYNNINEESVNSMEAIKPQLPKILRGAGTGGPDIYTILSCRGKRYGATEMTMAEVANQYKNAGTGQGSIGYDPEKDDGTKVDATVLEGKNLTDFYEKLGSTEEKDLAEQAESAQKAAEEKAKGAYKGFWAETWGSLKETFGKVWDGYTASAFDSTKWLAFRLEKDSDNASESFSNSLSQSSLQEELNGFAATNRRNNLDASTAGWGVLGWLNKQQRRISTWTDTLGSILSTNKGAGAISSVLAFTLSGNGYYDLPQQWSGSSFSRSCNINVRLRSRTGGDPVSVYTNVLIPFACLLAGACPRANGASTYTSPYIVRAYCRGMFAIPAGMITNLSITRGDSEFGWSVHRLPTTIAIQIQITDLSPILFIGLAGSGAGPTELFSLFKQAFVNNTKMHDYLDTLSGMGLKQRIYWGMSTLRNIEIAKRITASHWCNPTYWGMLFADTWMSRTVMAFRRAGNMNVPSN